MARMTNTSFMTGVKNWVLGKIANIMALIPNQASSSNQLADKNFVNSSIATATATFRGTYNVVSDLSLSYNATHAQIEAALAMKMAELSIVADNNDYAFVQIPTTDATPTEIAKIEKYKYNGTAWAFEYELNNSGFTAAQWAAINSGATLELIGKLSALPTNSELTTILNGKASKAENATAGHLASLDANGNPTDSGISLEDNGAYDVTAHNSGAKFADLSALLSNVNLNTLIPIAVRKGGMSIKFVQSSDNKYVQWRLMSDTFNTTPANWQGVDDVPTAGSDNLVKSGGVAERETDINPWFIPERNKISNFNASKKSVFNAIKDIWFENASGIFDNDAYVLQVGLFATDSNVLADISKMWLAIRLTNNQGTSAPNMYNYDFYKVAIQKQDNLTHVVIAGEITEMGKCHMLIDLSGLDFTDATTYSSYYLLVNEGINVNNRIFIRKRKTSYLLPQKFYPMDVTPQRNPEHYVLSEGVFNSINSNCGNHISSQDELTANNQCIYSSYDTAAISEITGFGVKTYNLQKGDIISVYGHGAGNNAVFMISKQIDSQTYKCLCRESTNTSTDRYYSYIADEDGVYAICAYIVSGVKNNVFIYKATLMKQIIESAQMNNTYKLFNYQKLICCGDSVTKGYCREGTSGNPDTYAQENPERAYPAQLKKMYPFFDITVKAQSGISAIGWLDLFYPQTDFSEYDMIIFELGLNGQLNIEDIDTPNTNTYAYKTLIAGVRNQNSSAVIVLVASSHFSDSWGPVLNQLADDYNCIVVDLKNTTYLNLDSAVYHGYYNDGGVAKMDWAHFTRKGYNAKAFVLSRLISDQLTDSTQY